jgi:anhydro-N-acetylmuramic acid kinase
VAKLDLDYDDKGEIAISGKINKQLLEELNKLPFYNLQPPKSLGFEWVQEIVLPIIVCCSIEVSDIVGTINEHAAIQISKYLYQNNLKTLITGGGAYNLFLIERIKRLSNSKIIIPNTVIIEYKEALIFGLLGVLKVRNEINCLKSVTGARKDHSSGRILEP